MPPAAVGKANAQVWGDAETWMSSRENGQSENIFKSFRKLRREEKSENRGKAYKRHISAPSPHQTLNKQDTYNPTYPTSGSLPSRNQRPYTGFPNKTNKFSSFQ